MALIKVTSKVNQINISKRSNFTLTVLSYIGKGNEASL